MTIDSDTFCRFRLLAQRLQHLYPMARPREKPAMVGRMGSHLVYFENTVPDDTEDDKAEDHLVKGRWYPYPLGIGYMLRFLFSSFFYLLLLTLCLLQFQPHRYNSQRRARSTTSYQVPIRRRDDRFLDCRTQRFP